MVFGATRLARRESPKQAKQAILNVYETNRNKKANKRMEGCKV